MPTTYNPSINLVKLIILQVFNVNYCLKTLNQSKHFHKAIATNTSDVMELNKTRNKM